MIKNEKTQSAEEKELQKLQKKLFRKLVFGNKKDIKDLIVQFGGTVPSAVSSLSSDEVLDLEQIAKELYTVAQNQYQIMPFTEEEIFKTLKKLLDELSSDYSEL